MVCREQGDVVVTEFMYVCMLSRVQVGMVI